MKKIKQKMICIAVSMMVLMSGIIAQKDPVDTLIRNIMQKSKIPGLQLAVIYNGKIIKLGSYGLASVEFNIPVTRETVFPINSMTKAFTGVALMQLVEAGKLELSAPLSRYLDSLPEAWRGVTIQQLSTHLSGLPDIVDGNMGLIDPRSEEASLLKAEGLPIDGKPGEQFRYNQLNYALLGRVIQKLSGETFEQFIAARQFRMAGMPLTAYHDSRDVVPYMGRTYTYLRFTSDDVLLTDSLMNRYEEIPPIIRTAAGIYTTAEELAHWIIAIQGQKLLKKQESLKSMWTPGRLSNGQTAGFSDLLNGYAIGWPVVTRPEHSAIATVGGERAGLFIYPGDGITVIVLTNLMGASPQAFIDQIAAYYFKK